ncbi:hypothetical protein F9B85_07010 [Heliorestis acidaminivorans]|uniref:Uncharacterized protein n=1 Tax=Heliorestis acidaminivorans TaxID=553427 RepID=A0A6I0F336_9FIRM|nr:DUF6042 family protein [Heliorestis acidaminivorans]KAB2953006.1 hypothetical protein F9B85_07010 [Heliorestis acidaminivorans]
MSLPTSYPGLRNEPGYKQEGLVRIPTTFFDYRWPHYLPPSATSLYRAICRIAEGDLRGPTARYELLDRPYEPWPADNSEEEINQLLFQNLCTNKGWPMPTTVAHCLDLLLKMSLIQVHLDEAGNEIYDIVLPVPHPADVLQRPELRLPPYLLIPPEQAL